MSPLLLSAAFDPAEMTVSSLLQGAFSAWRHVTRVCSVRRMAQRHRLISSPGDQLFYLFQLPSQTAFRTPWGAFIDIIHPGRVRIGGLRALCWPFRRRLFSVLPSGARPRLHPATSRAHPPSGRRRVGQPGRRVPEARCGPRYWPGTPPR